MRLKHSNYWRVHKNGWAATGLTFYQLSDIWVFHELWFTEHFLEHLARCSTINWPVWSTFSSLTRMRNEIWTFKIIKSSTITDGSDYLCLLVWHFTPWPTFESIPRALALQHDVLPTDRWDQRLQGPRTTFSLLVWWSINCSKHKPTAFGELVWFSINWTVRSRLWAF